MKHVLYTSQNCIHQLSQTVFCLAMCNSHWLTPAWCKRGWILGQRSHVLLTDNSIQIGGTVRTMLPITGNGTCPSTNGCVPTCIMIWGGWATLEQDWINQLVVLEVKLLVRTVGATYRECTKNWCLALVPGLLHLQSLITCSMQQWRVKPWEIWSCAVMLGRQRVDTWGGCPTKSWSPFWYCHSEGWRWEARVFVRLYQYCSSTYCSWCQRHITAKLMVGHCPWCVYPLSTWHHRTWSGLSPW